MRFTLDKGHFITGEMIERLTNTGSNGEIWITDNDETRRFGRKESAYKKLADYEDLEEQNRLVILPCKVGDDIYAIPSEVNYRLNKSFGAKGLNAICRQVVDHIEFNSYGYLVSTNESMTVHRQEAFGETWFLTRDEAEKKLKEMESN